MEKIKEYFQGFIKFEDLLEEYGLYLGIFLTAIYDKRHQTDYECEICDVLIKHRHRVSKLRYFLFRNCFFRELHNYLSRYSFKFVSSLLYYRKHGNRKRVYYQQISLA